MGWESGIAMSCGVGRRCSLDLVLLWLWCRPAATALLWPLAWELPYAAGVALKSQKKKDVTKESGTIFSWLEYEAEIGDVRTEAQCSDCNSARDQE